MKKQKSQQCGCQVIKELSEKMPSADGAANAPNPLAEQVYKKSKSDIFNFGLFPSDLFSENSIAQHYGVSRTPMRDGLFRPQREGYLEVGFRRGWKVLHTQFRPTRSTLRLAHSVGGGVGRTHCKQRYSAYRRRCVESDLVRRAQVARKRSDNDVREMDENFHRRLVAATGMPKCLGFTTK
jgi:DNA-binding GntR family transcriptional regulator